MPGARLAPVRTSLAGLAQICQTPRPLFPANTETKLFHRLLYFSCRLRSLAVTLLLLGPIGGCTLWDRDRWNLDRFRDERAVDIDHRLDTAEPIVQNPF